MRNEANFWAAKPDLTALSQHSLVCSLLFPVKLSSCFPLRTRHFRIKTGILFINPRFCKLLGGFKTRVESNFPCPFGCGVHHTQCSSEGFVALFLPTNTLFNHLCDLISRKNIVSNGGGKCKQAQTLSLFKCHAPLH